MKGKVVLFMLFIGFSFFSCSNVTDDTSSNPPNNNALKYLDITDAKNLYISTGNTSNRSAGNGASSQKIFKITEDGYVEEVKYLDKEKNEITISNQPTAILPVNDEYIFVGFGSGTWIESSYLVRKSDGAVFDMKNAGNPLKDHNDYKNGNMIKMDNNNNMYLVTYGGASSNPNSKIVKVNLDGVESLSFETVSTSVDSVGTFDVDWSGNIVYHYDNATANGSRIRKINGSYETSKFDIRNSWIGLDGNFYFISYDEDRDEEGNYISDVPIKRMTVDNDYKVKYETCGYIDMYSISFSRASAYKMVVKDKFFFVGFDNILEIYNEGNSVSMRKIELNTLDIKSIVTTTSSENYYYVAGLDTSSKTFLVKINPDSNECTHLLNQGEYDVFSFTASETDGITFNALRMSDGKKVIGKVGINGGDVTMIDEESNAEISYLERIN